MAFSYRQTPRKILVVSAIYPYPTHNGGAVDIFHRLKTLRSLGYSISLVAFYNPQFPPEIEPLKPFCETIYPIPVLRRHPRILFGSKPYFMASRENWNALENACDQLQQEEPPFCVIAESHNALSTALYLRDRCGIPELLLRVHNNEPKFIYSLACSSPLFSLRRAFYTVEAIRYFFREKTLLNGVEEPMRLLHISSDECESYQKRFPHLDHLFLPAAVDLAELKPYVPKQKPRVLFVGALCSPNNLEGLQWFLNKVHPLLQQKFADYECLVAGSSRGVSQKQLQKFFMNISSLRFIDTPEDLNPLYEEAMLFINPMLSGAGVKLKTVQAILQGLPVVSTPVGNEGTGFIDGIHLQVASTPEIFASKIATLLENEHQRRALVNEAHLFLRHHYDQERTLKDILEG